MAEDTINEFQVESVFPHGSDETTVTGHVAKGTLRTGETVSLTSASGVPLLAPIVRLGSAETPINVVRSGQRTTLVLRVEPQHVVPGSRLTSRGSGHVDDATVIVQSGQDKGRSRGEIEAHAELAEAEHQVNSRHFEEAERALEAYIAAKPDSCAANRLLARIYLESEPPLLNVDKALEYIKHAYESGGHDDPEVQETLAAALGAHGEAEHGLRYLERLYEMATLGEERDRYQDRIQRFRSRYNVPDLWEFMDQFGGVVYQSSNLEDIAKAIANGSIPKNGDCRKNKVGGMLSMEESILREHPELVSNPVSKANLNRTLDIAIGAGAGLLLGVLLDAVLGIPAMISITAGAVAGASAVLFLTQRRAKEA